MAFKRPAFFPAFGSRPTQLVGREQAIGDLLDALASKPLSRTRTLLVTGQRGMGKTALMREMADWAEAQGYLALQATPTDDLYAQVLQLGAKQALFIGVDDVRYGTSSLRALATACTRLQRQGKQVVLALAGYPRNLEAALTDSTLAPLARGHWLRLGPLPQGKVQVAYERALARQGTRAEEGALEQAAVATQGHPFLLQLMGAYLLAAAQEDSHGVLTCAAVQQALAATKADLPHTLYAPVLAGLSPKDLEFLRAMACDGDASSVAGIRARLGVADNYLQPYRARLLRAGAIVSPRRGTLAFALPYLGEYLLQQASR